MAVSTREVISAGGIRLPLRAVPTLWLARGDLVILAFLTTQALDGVLTYIGLLTFGPTIEGNPLLAWLMTALGQAPALTGAKILSAACGMFLHLVQLHGPLGLLTGMYVAGAIVPWLYVLFS